MLTVINKSIYKVTDGVLSSVVRKYSKTASHVNQRGWEEGTIVSASFCYESYMCFLRLLFKLLSIVTPIEQIQLKDN